MGKNKLRKFSEMESMDCVFQYPFGILREKGFPMKGSWGRDYFGSDNPRSEEHTSELQSPR